MGRVLLAGVGDLGGGLARRLVADGEQVHGLRRRADAVPAGVRPLRADLRDPDALRAVLEGIGPLDAVVVAVTADERTAAAYRATYRDGTANLRGALDAQGVVPGRWVFVSSTAVYGQRDGSWVDETSQTRPRSPTGRAMLEAEREVLGGAAPAVVVRFGGIYGPGRTRLLERVRRGEATVPEVVQYTNRIHRDDAIGVLAHVLDLDRPESVYAAVDHDPAPRAEVVAWLADRLGAPTPPRTPGEGRRGRNKRVDNSRLVASGYRFRFPTFREGYRALLAGD